MKNYSINYLDAEGRTQTSELRSFENNRTAVDFARIGLLRSAIVEVWDRSDLVGRIFREAASQATWGSDRAGRSSLDNWDNEGGAAVPGEGARH